MKHNFREIESWKRSFELTQMIYRRLEGLPRFEQYGLVSQIQRCAVSIPSNIAEGSGRGSDKEFIRYLNIAISSSYELETQLLLAECLHQVEVGDITYRLRDIQRLIGGLKRKLSRYQ